MKISNKTFTCSIIITLVFSILCSIMVRKSIQRFDFEDIYTKANELIYYPYNDIEYSNGYFVDIENMKDLDSLYNYIVKGKATGKREVLYGTVLTEIEVQEVIKGDISSKFINIYEPIGVETNTIWTFEGYNFIKNNKDYIFCLTDIENKKKENTYIYATPFLGKFPLIYEHDEFNIYDDSISDKGDRVHFNNFESYEQVFISSEKMEKYFNEYRKIIKLTIKEDFINY